MHPAAKEMATKDTKIHEVEHQILLRRDSL